MRLLVIGAGGHAKVVTDAADAAGIEIAGVIGTSGDPADVLGHPVTFDAEDTLGADAFIVAVGDNRTRAEMYRAWCGRGLAPASIVHPAATIAPSADIGPGTFVAAGAIVNPAARVGADAIINTGCTIDHDCVVGDHALIGPTASLCGGASVGEGTLVGAGANLLPGVNLGAWAIVGAGATVVCDLPGNEVYTGIPARPVRETGSDR